MSIKYEFLNGVFIRIKALILLIATVGSGITTLILEAYPAKDYPAAKFICLGITIIGIIWQSNARPLIRGEVGGEINHNVVDIVKAKLNSNNSE